MAVDELKNGIPAVIGGEEGRTVPTFLKDAPTREFIRRVYTDFQYAENEKQRDFIELNGRKLTRFWKDSRDDYNVLLPPRKSWHKRARRSITRDKANTFIANLTKNVIKGEIIAQNPDQDIDLKAARVFRAGVDHIEREDKWARNFVGVVSTTVIDGTAHVREDVVNGKCVRTLVPNENIFIKQSYQPDLQRQEVFFEVAQVPYHDAKLDFGHLENFQHVQKGPVENWLNGEMVTECWSGNIDNDDMVQVVRVQYHRGYEKNGKPRRKFYNVLINGVPMYKHDQLSPYAHGRYNYANGVLERFANQKFYWGNSLGNKLRHDAELADAFYSMIINKAWLSIFPPLASKLSTHLGDDVIRPANIIPVNEDVKTAIGKIPGIGEPLNVSDSEILRIIDGNLDRGSVSQQASGSDSIVRQTASEALIKQEAIKTLMGLFGQMISFFVEDLTEMTISNFLQFYTKKNIERIVEGSEFLFKANYNFPNQTLGDGRPGDLKVAFTEQLPETDEGRFELSRQMYKAEKNSARPIDLMVADTSYLESICYYVIVVANPVEELSQLQREAMAIEKYKNVYFNNPNINQGPATRKLVRQLGDDEGELVKESMGQLGPGLGGQGMSEGVGAITRQVNAPTKGFNRMKDMVQGNAANAAPQMM